jgi:hypothetical protein
MAGYSGKSLTQKLGIRPGFCIFVDGAPSAYGGLVGQLPAGATLAARLKAPLAMVHVFATCMCLQRKPRGLPAGCAVTAPRSRRMA